MTEGSDERSEDPATPVRSGAPDDGNRACVTLVTACS